MHEHVRRLMDVQDDLATDPFFHIFYDDLVRDPISQVRHLYRKLGRTLSPEVEASMRNWLVNNPKNKHGPFTYDPATFGISKDCLSRQFEDYRNRFLLSR